MIHLIEGSLYQKLLFHILAALPNEAVGLIYPDESVIPMKNLEDDTNFSVSREELLSLLGLAQNSDMDIAEVVLWHSHPNGGIGPSRTDLQQRTPLNHHLVLTLVQGELIPTWY